MGRLRSLNSVALTDITSSTRISIPIPCATKITRLIKDRVSLEDRAAIIGAMWEISLADNHRSANEETAIRLVSALLGVTDRDSALQRRRVAGR